MERLAPEYATDNENDAWNLAARPCEGTIGPERSRQKKHRFAPAKRLLKAGCAARQGGSEANALRAPTAIEEPHRYISRMNFVAS